jgi:hypothetical protein
MFVVAAAIVLFVVVARRSRDYVSISYAMTVGTAFVVYFHLFFNFMMGHFDERNPFEPRRSIGGSELCDQNVYRRVVKIDDAPFRRRCHISTTGTDPKNVWLRLKTCVEFIFYRYICAGMMMVLAFYSLLVLAYFSR